MKPGLTGGMSRKRRFEVNDESTIGFMGEGRRIYAILFMPRALDRS